MKGVSVVIATLLMLIITISLAYMAFSYISRMFTVETGKIVQIDQSATTCIGTTITVYIKNIGRYDFTSNNVQIYLEGGTPAACDTTAETVVAGGGVVKCDTTLTGRAGNNVVVASGTAAGPTNTAKIDKWCPG